MDVAGTTAQVLNGDTTNLLLVGLFVTALVVIFTILAKNHLISFRGKHFKIGYDDRTREIIRRQLEYASNAVQRFEALLPRTERYNQYRAKYVSEKCFDEIVTWISVNHLSDDDFYVQNKQMIIWNIIHGIEQKDIYKTEEFQKTVNEVVKDIISRLIQIREFYLSH